MLPPRLRIHTRAVRTAPRVRVCRSRLPAPLLGTDRRHVSTPAQPSLARSTHVPHAFRAVPGSGSPLHACPLGPGLMACASPRVPPKLPASPPIACATRSHAPDMCCAQQHMSMLPTIVRTRPARRGGLGPCTLHPPLRCARSRFMLVAAARRRPAGAWLAAYLILLAALPVGSWTSW